MQIARKENNTAAGGDIVFLLQTEANINRSARPTPFDLPLQDKTCLTVVVNSKGHIGSDDVIEANLAVLWGAVSIQSLHTHNSVKQTAFWDRGLVATLDKHGGELIDVVHTNMHGGPEGGREGGRETKHKQGEIDYINDRKQKCLHDLYRAQPGGWGLGGGLC